MSAKSARPSARITKTVDEDTLQSTLLWIAPSSASACQPTILADGIERARAKPEYTPLAAAFCPALFTIAHLRHVYYVVWVPPRRSRPR